MSQTDCYAYLQYANEDKKLSKYWLDCDDVTTVQFGLLDLISTTVAPFVYLPLSSICSLADTVRYWLGFKRYRIVKTS